MEGLKNLSQYSTVQYYKSIAQGYIITFDSGQSKSLRRKYIHSTLLYLLNIKGRPAMVLSTVDPQITKGFLCKLPQNLRNNILNIGLFHLYLNVLTKFKQILQSLYYSNEYRKYIELFFCSMRAIEVDLLKQLKKLNVIVILDRSIISSYLYSKALLNNSLGWSQIFDLSDFKPYKCFFVHHDIDDKDLETYNYTENLYDQDKTLNHKIRGILPQVKVKVPALLQLTLNNDFEQNMKIIKNNLSEL